MYYFNFLSAPYALYYISAAAGSKLVWYILQDFKCIILGRGLFLAYQEKGIIFPCIQKACTNCTSGISKNRSCIVIVQIQFMGPFRNVICIKCSFICGFALKLLKFRKYVTHKAALRIGVIFFLKRYCYLYFVNLPVVIGNIDLRILKLYKEL